MDNALKSLISSVFFGVCSGACFLLSYVVNSVSDYALLVTVTRYAGIAFGVCCVPGVLYFAYAAISILIDFLRKRV